VQPLLLGSVRQWHWGDGGHVHGAMCTGILLPARVHKRHRWALLLRPPVLLPAGKVMCCVLALSLRVLPGLRVE
jgi:hypothetical protein